MINFRLFLITVSRIFLSLCCASLTFAAMFSSLCTPCIQSFNAVQLVEIEPSPVSAMRMTIAEVPGGVSGQPCVIPVHVGC